MGHLPEFLPRHNRTHPFINASEISRPKIVQGYVSICSALSIFFSSIFSLLFSSFLFSLLSLLSLSSCMFDFFLFSHLFPFFIKPLSHSLVSVPRSSVPHPLLARQQIAVLSSDESDFLSLANEIHVTSRGKVSIQVQPSTPLPSLNSCRPLLSQTFHSPLL